MYFVIQSEAKAQVSALSDVYRYETALSSNWFRGFFGSLVIGQSDYFDFASPTLN